MIRGAADACDEGKFTSHLVRPRARRGAAPVRLVVEDGPSEAASIDDEGRIEPFKPGLVPAVGFRSLRRRASALEWCGQEPVSVSVWANTKGESGAKCAHMRCRDRLCPTCAKIGAASVGKALSEILANELAFGQASLPERFEGEPNAIENHWNDGGGARLFFLTLTVRHHSGEKLREVRKCLDRAWASLIRRKLWRDSVAEHHRAGEIEYTTKGGWHPHFHVIFKLRPGCRASHMRRDLFESEIRETWASITRRMKRESIAVSLQEQVRSEKPGMVKRFERTKDGWETIDVPLGKVVSELVKYVTKRQAGGTKRGQLGFFDYTPAMVAEYAAGIMHWNLHCSSDGWATAAQAFDEEEKLELPEGAGEVRSYAWAEICDLAEQGADRKLTGAVADDWAEHLPLIVAACEAEKLPHHARALRQYLMAFMGDDFVDLPRLRVKPWQRESWKNECRELEAAEVERRRAVEEHYKQGLFGDVDVHRTDALFVLA